jgi:AAA15 family ATPase/GTPase
MYTSFHVKNFRGFEDLELNDLARVNLIAGKNNVGKTALLEALYVHARAYNPQEIVNLNFMRGLSFEQASDIRLNFYMRDTSLRVILEGHDRKTEHRSVILRMVSDVEELAKVNITVSADRYSNGTPTVAENLPVFALDYAHGKGGRSGTVYLSSLSQGRINLTGALPPPFPAYFTPAQGRSTSEELAELVSKLDIAGYQEILLDALSILVPSLKRISVLYLNDKPIVWAEIGTNRLPLNLLGEGTNRLANFIVSLVDARDGVIFIDEIENGLHHSVLASVWKTLAKVARQFNVQIFATTHSLEAIYAAHEVFRSEGAYDFQLLRLDQNEKTGKITAVTYDEEIMEAAVEANFEVR